MIQHFFLLLLSVDVVVVVVDSTTNKRPDMQKRKFFVLSLKHDASSFGIPLAQKSNKYGKSKRRRKKLKITFN